jgi:hypothetical protein
MPMHTLSDHRHQFPPNISQHAGWRYFRFSPCKPSSTMRIFSSAENFRRVTLRMSRTVFSALPGWRPFLSVIVTLPGLR